MKKNGKQVLFLGGIYYSVCNMDSFATYGRRAATGAECNEYWICNIQLLVSSFNKC